MEPSLGSGWGEIVKPEFNKPYFKQLEAFLAKEINLGAIVYPPENQIFNAFKYTPFDAVKVVIIGQDPYHGAGQANGLAFSVNSGIKIPPSLRNIYKELSLEFDNFQTPHSGDLSGWAKQGVFLLNTSLTVRAGEAGSHQLKGWEIFTDQVIRKLSENKNNLVFLLWGKHAIQKAELINTKRHAVFTAAHPSPFSAHRGFFGCNHFQLANQYLSANNKDNIDWQQIS